MIPRVLVVDDDAAVRFTVRSVLEDAGLKVLEAADGSAALATMDDEAPIHVVVSDLRMPGMDGMELLRALALRPDPPRVILVTAHGDERVAVQAMKAGAWDYFRKPFDIDDLLAVVERACAAVRLQGDNERLRSELNLARSLVFASPAMSRLAVLVQRLGAREATVLITGESGTGKERVAEAVVRASSRADAPFVRFNCASLGADLAEAELFGHARGAFTGAVRARPGLFREADGGTLLLDEVGELAPGVQARLLRVLQSGEVRPVGVDRPVKVNVRIIAATHRDLATLSAKGDFRQDLYYRLKVVVLHVPPLRDRPQDIAPLARHFLARYLDRYDVGPVPVTAALLAKLQARSWPGNVRELQNTIEMMVALSADGELDLGLLNGSPAWGAVRDEDPTPGGSTLRARVETYELALILQAIEEAEGNKAEAARALGIGRVTLYDKLRRMGQLGSEPAS